MSTQSLPLHCESTVLVHSPADRVFAYLDDPKSMAAHTGEPSMMMMGAHMSIEVDRRGGREIGSKNRMDGRMMGMPLSLEEVIIGREAPHKKVWETIGSPRLLVIAHYRMGFELTPAANASVLRVFIDYNLPDTAPGNWLGHLFGGFYARWCTKRMTNDAAGHFKTTVPPAKNSP